MSDRHIEICLAAMRDYQWHTLPELADEIGCSEAAASARVRDLRKSKYGGHTVRCVRAPGQNGLHLYRLVPPRTTIGNSHEQTHQQRLFSI